MGWCGSWIVFFRRPRLECFCAAWTAIRSSTTDITAPPSAVDIRELVCGKVCGTPPLNHAGMGKLRSLGQYTGIGYTYHGDGVWRMAYAQKKCVTFARMCKKHQGGSPYNQRQRRIQNKAFAYDYISSLFSIHVLLNAVVFRITELLRLFVVAFWYRLVEACNPKFLQMPMSKPFWEKLNFCTRVWCAPAEPLTNVFFVFFPTRYSGLVFWGDIWVLRDPTFSPEKKHSHTHS